MFSAFTTGLFSFAALSVAVCLPAQAGIKIDFAQETAQSSYRIFGGCSVEHTLPEAWEKLARAGVTSMRFDLKLGVFPEPKDITLEQFKAAMGKKGGVADINSRHWNWERMDRSIALARKHGMETISIFDYCPAWLAYNEDIHSPPRDWAVWENLVTQIVRRYAGKIDYWEIWNEPNGSEYLKVEGTPYPPGKEGMFAAYLDLCRHTLAGIKASGIEVRVGGPTLATHNSGEFMDRFLGQAEIVRQLDFISDHLYFHVPIPNRCLPPQIDALQKKHGVAGPLPLFITEWNARSSVMEKPFELKNSPAAVGWIGKAFILLMQWGVDGANFFRLGEGKAIDDNLGGGFAIVKGKPQLFRYVKVFHLLSKTLGLGERGDNIRVFATKVAGLAEETDLPPHFLDSLYAIGCRNARNVPVVVVANPSATERIADLSLEALPAGRYRVLGYVARPDHTPEEAIEPTPLFEREIVFENGELRMSFALGAGSVAGLRLERIGN